MMKFRSALAIRVLRTKHRVDIYASRLSYILDDDWIHHYNVHILDCWMSSHLVSESSLTRRSRDDFTRSPARK